MRKVHAMCAAGALAFAAAVSAAARSCSVERNQSGFDARLPLPEGAMVVSCTEWIGSSGICMAEAGAFGKSGSIDVLLSPKHRHGELSLSIPLTGKRLALEADAKKGLEARTETER